MTPRPSKPPEPPRHHTVDEVRVFLRAECRRLGSQAAFARAWHLPEGFVSEVLSGEKDPSLTILTALKLSLRKCYVPLEAGAER